MTAQAPTAHYVTNQRAPLLPTRYRMIKPGTDQILPDLHTKERGERKKGVCW